MTEHTYRSGSEKAAILMLALGHSEVADLFARLDMEEVKEISQTMAMLGRVTTESVETVLHDFIQQGQTGGLIGGFDSTERLLARFLDPDRVGQIMEEIRGPAGRTVWAKLGNVNETVLASYLKNEYPQTVAVVLSRIEPDHAARVLACLPEEAGTEVVMRMLHMEIVQKDILADVERTLRGEFMSNLARTNRRDNHEVMAEIFNHFDRSTETRFMASLEDHSKDSAERIRALMFTFEDMIKLDASGVQTVLRSAGNNRVGMALKGASEPLRELFFKNMSERAAKIMKDDMDAMGGVRLKDVEEAQQFIVNATKDLVAAGEIVIGNGKDEDLLY